MPLGIRHGRRLGGGGAALAVGGGWGGGEQIESGEEQQSTIAIQLYLLGRHGQGEHAWKQLEVWALLEEEDRKLRKALWEESSTLRTCRRLPLHWEWEGGKHLPLAENGYLPKCLFLQ